MKIDQAAIEALAQIMQYQGLEEIEYQDEIGRAHV